MTDCLEVVNFIKADPMTFHNCMRIWRKVKDPIDEGLEDRRRSPGQGGDEEEDILVIREVSLSAAEPLAMLMHNMLEKYVNRKWESWIEMDYCMCGSLVR